MAAVSANKPGIGARAYRNTGTYGTPTWSHVDKTLSASVAQQTDMVEAGSRATTAKVYMPARTDLVISLQIKADDADSHYQAIRSAAAARSAVDLLILDGLIATEGVRGFRGEFIPVLTNADQNPDGSIYDTFDLKATPTTNAAGPSTVVMGAASAPTFTAF